MDWLYIVFIVLFTIIPLLFDNFEFSWLIISTIAYSIAIILVVKNKTE